MAFNISADRRIRLMIETEQGNEEVVHIFRNPMTDNYIAYQDTVRKEGLMSADLELWKNCIKSVEGYEADGQDVMKIDNWKDLIPANHKRTTVEGLVRCWLPQPDKQKNSARTSG